VEILEKDRRPARKTHIMSSVGLSFDQAEKHLSTLRKAGFIAEKSGFWKTTEKRFHVIEACKICRRLIREAPY